MKPFELLTKRGRVRRYRQALAQALRDYPVAWQSLRLVSLESKPVFCVETPSARFAAKFHDASQHADSQMRGETQFLAHVSTHAGLLVEAPLPNNQGDLVTVVQSEGLPVPAQVALYRWLPGRQLSNHIPPVRIACSARVPRCSTWRRGRSGLSVTSKF